jgi:hypothetical protein
VHGDEPADARELGGGVEVRVHIRECECFLPSVAFQCYVAVGRVGEAVLLVGAVRLA